MDVMNGATRREIAPREGTSAVSPLLLNATPFLIGIKEEFQMMSEQIPKTKERRFHPRTIRDVLVFNRRVTQSKTHPGKIGIV